MITLLLHQRAMEQKLVTKPEERAAVAAQRQSTRLRIKTLEVVGLIPVGWWAFLSPLSIPQFCVLNQAPHGDATLNNEMDAQLRSLGRKKNNMHRFGKKN